MAIVIGDVHGDPLKVRRFLDHTPDVEHVVLGDIIDSYDKRSFEDELACLDLLLASDSILIWGNHDLAYLPERPWDCGGYVGVKWTELSSRFQGNRHRFLAAYAVDSWLLTHGGVSPEVAVLIPPTIVEAGATAVAGWLNHEFLQELATPQYQIGEGPKRYGAGPLFNRPRCRGGLEPFGGIFWFDPHGEMVDPCRSVGSQIHGHTPVPYPERGQTWINLNAFEGAGIWVYDTERGALSCLPAK